MTQWSKGNRVPGDDTLRRLEEAADLPPHFLRIQKRLNKLEADGYSINQLTDPRLLEARGDRVIFASDSDLDSEQREALQYVLKGDFLGLAEWAISKSRYP